MNTQAGLNSCDEREYLSMEEAAQVMGVSAAVLRPIFAEYVKSGGRRGIAHAVVGGKLKRTTRRDLREWYEGQKKRTASAPERG